MAAVRDLINPGRLTRIVNVGASPVDGAPFYKTMLDEGLCEVVGFEPNREAYTDLVANKGPNEIYLPYTIGMGGERTMNATAMPGMYSLLEPDGPVLAAFEQFSEWGNVTETATVNTVPLDKIPEVSKGIDVLCMDVQGSELEVLASGQNVLGRAVAVLTEVSWVPLYKNQPAFGHTDVVLRQLGFLPHCFAETKLWPIKCGARFASDPHQLLESDILYVRDFTKFMPPEMWRQLAMVAHYLAGSADLAMRCIYALVQAGALHDDARQGYIDLMEAA